MFDLNGMEQKQKDNIKVRDVEGESERDIIIDFLFVVLTRASWTDRALS